MWRSRLEVMAPALVVASMALLHCASTTRQLHYVGLSLPLGRVLPVWGRSLELRGGGGAGAGENGDAAGTAPAVSGNKLQKEQGGTVSVESCSCGGTAGDDMHPPDPPSEEQTNEEMMEKMVGAMVTVNLKMGPQVRGRLQSIDGQMNMMLQRPVEQWVNGTLVSVDDADVFVRCHNVLDFGVVRGTEDPATVKILQDLGIRPAEDWDDSPTAPPC